MKYININSVKTLLLLMMASFVISSCEDPDKAPIVTFDSAGHGAYPRLLSEVGERSVDFFDIPNSQYEYSVEFVDEDGGNTVTEYIVDLEYIDVNGTDSKAPAEFLKFAASEFTTSTEGFKAVENIVVSATAMIAAVGLTEADVSQADKFIITGKLVTQSGLVHTGANSSASVQGAAFRGHFDVTLAVVCPSDLAGTHTYSTVPWCGGAPVIGVSVWVTESNGVYSIDGGDYAFGAYFPCYSPTAALPEGNLRINDLCNTLSWTGASQWGELYIFNSVTVSGADLIMDWDNDYGEAGITTLTREGGANWPPLTN